ncbi:MAG: hypothetical protein HY657_11530 [Acidobacteria bacterium]|nr:hypothetical protein [Acidobacteriota bacterium]
MTTATIQMLLVGSLKANDYNPNRMTAEAFGALLERLDPCDPGRPE